MQNRIANALNHSPKHKNAFINALVSVPATAVAYAAAICRDLCAELGIRDFPNPFMGGENPSDDYLIWDEAFNGNLDAAFHAPGHEPEADEPDAPEDEDTGEPGILDGTIPSITAALEGLNAEKLAQLRADEEAGNTRAGVIKAIDKALEALADASEDAPDTTETNEDGDETTDPGSPPADTE